MANLIDRKRVVGDLKNFTIFDITHTLMMSRKTALVSIVRGAKKGYIYFQEGQIVAALDDELACGEAAAYKIFFWRGGQFTIDFDVQAPERNIKLETESLLLEIARNLDEGQRDKVIADDGSDASDVVSEKFEDRFRVELNKVFSKVATNTSPSRDRYTVTAFDTLLAALNDLNGSALFIRPGCRPRIKTTNGFTTIDQDPVRDDEIRGFLNALLSATEKRTFDEEKEVSVYYSTSAAGTFAVRGFHDQGRAACIFSPASRSIPPLASLSNEAAELATLIESDRGLVLLVGATGGGKTTVLASLLEHGLVTRDLLVTLFGDTQTYAFSEESGFLIRSPLARFSRGSAGTLQVAIAQGTDLVAIDEIESSTDFETALAVASHSALVVATMEADDVETLAERINEWCRAPGGEKLAKRLAAALIAVVDVDLNARARGESPIRRLSITDAHRAQMTAGRFDPLGSVTIP